MTLLGQIECSQCEISHALKRNQVALFKCIGMIGEKLEQSSHFAVTAQHGQNHNRGDAKGAARFEIYPGISFGIIATQ